MSFQARQAPFRELVIDAFANLYALRQRSALALLGIVIGTASVVAMLTIGHMAEREALKLFSHMGVNMLVARSSGGGPNLPGLDLATVESLPQREPAIEAATALSTGPLGTDLDLPGPPITVVAATPTLQDLAGLSVQSGRFITPVDADDLVAVLGAEAAAKLSKPGDAVGVGRQLRVGRYIFNVIGILAQAPATAFDPADFNTAIIIPLSGGRQATGQAAINAAMARMRPNADAKAAITALTSDLRAASPKAQFQVQSARQLIATVKAQKAVHTRLLAAIGGISLLVGGIGVMNVMLMGVMERRREIGLRAAIGATPLDIQLMFLVEAAALALTGGIVGALVGLGAAFLTAKGSGWTFSPALYALPLGAGVATLVGVGFGLYPAVTASRLDPIEALRAD
jgi:putative ABC transport system permease protein